MPLVSKLLRGDSKLEACLVSDPAHVTPGSRGDHVARIQIALNVIEGAGLDVDGIYGALTAKAVKAYKDPRRILQPTQKSADDIVGKKTIASLDRDLAAIETQKIEIIVQRPVARASTPQLRGPATPVVRLGFAIPASLANILTIDPPQPTKAIRLKPRETADLLIKNPGGQTFVSVTNNPPARGDITDRIAWLFDPSGPTDGRLAPEPNGVAETAPNKTSGNKHFLVRKGDFPMGLDGYRPGDAVLTATTITGQVSSLDIAVRAPRLGPVQRPPLTKLKPGSRFFSADDSGEFDPHGVFNGRPVSPNRGGRLINLGGEQETPEFEDYQVNIGFSGYARPFTNNVPVFRPMFDDPDPSVGIRSKSASHICIRGNPLTPEFVAAIKAVAMPGALFTFSGAESFARRAQSLIGGTVEEDKFLSDGEIVLRL